MLGSVFIFSSISDSVFSLAEFSSPELAYIGICSTLLTVIIFSVVTWALGMPSSESHAMMSSLVGSCLFLGDGAYKGGLFKVLLFAIISCALSFLISVLLGLALKLSRLNCRASLLTASVLSSLMHGAQDGQKFIGILLFLSPISNTSRGFFGILSLSLLVSLFMSLGTLCGGGRIIRSLGEKTVKLNERSCLASDISFIISTVIFSVMGAPISTGLVKSTAIMGGGLSFGEKINKKTATELFLTSVATFPVCILLSGLISLGMKLLFV